MFELTTDNSRLRVPLPAELLTQLTARFAALNGNVVRLHGNDERLVFLAPEGGPIDYHNFRDRVWLPLLERTKPDPKHPNRVAVTGTFHQLRHSYATALIQSGENAKTVQTLLEHHSVAFTMDQHADAWPDAIAGSGEKVSGLLFATSGSKTVATDSEATPPIAEVFCKMVAGVGFRTHRLALVA